MKKNILLGMLLVGLFFFSCNKNQKDTTSQESEEKPVKVQCYVAIYEEDTIDLKINTLKNGKLSGNMEMKLLNMPIKIGKIVGEFRGDTLLVDYTFIQGQNEKVVFKNPMALLKKGEELVLGNGEIQTYLGKSYFAKGKPIDFENVKYKFSPEDCASD